MTTNELIAAKCFKSFEFFTRYFFRHKANKKFIIGEHHKIIFDAIGRVIDGDCKRLIINIAPRYSKTELVVKNLIAYSMAINPKSRFIHLSYSDQLALDNSEEVKDLINSHEYQELFPYVQVKKDSKAKNKWYTTAGGGVLARSASGQVTGFGAGQVEEEGKESNEFSGAIIIDDPIKPEDANSSTIRNKVNQRFDSTIRNRVNSRNTPIIIIMQRLHQEDLTGYLKGIEPDEWEVISLPVIKDDGSALWEHKHNIEELNHLKKINPSVFETQYMQNPEPPEGLLFRKNELNYFRGQIDKKESEGSAVFVDVADTGKDNHSVPVGYLIGNQIYVDDVLFTTEDTTKNVPRTAEIINKHAVPYARIESNFGGSMYKQLLSPLINEGTMLLPIRSKSNKHARIITVSGLIREFFVFRDDYEHGSEYHKFMQNVWSYMKDGTSEHDDAPDSLHGLCVLFKSFYNLWSEHKEVIES